MENCCVESSRIDLEELRVPLEEGTLMSAEDLVSVQYVMVYPPEERRHERCSVYGEVSFTDDLSKPPVTLFSRSVDHPDEIVLGHPRYGLLSLSDHRDHRPISARHHPFFVNVNLHEKLEESESDDGESEDEEEDDGLILNVVGFEYWHHFIDDSRCFLVQGDNGYSIEVCYAIVCGARVQVEVTMNRNVEEDASSSSPEEAIPRKRTSTGQLIPFKSSGRPSIFGCIKARHHFGTNRGSGATILYLRYDDEATPLCVGSPIGLDRRVAVAPVGYPVFLSVDFTLFSGLSGDLIAHEAVLFPIKTITQTQFVTNKDLTHVKQVLEGLFTVSIRFID